MTQPDTHQLACTCGRHFPDHDWAAASRHIHHAIRHRGLRTGEPHTVTREPLE